MKRQLGLLFLLIPAVVLGQVTVKGIVTEQNSGNKPLAGVQIKVLGSTPDQTGRDGLFQLVFTAREPGDRVVVSEITKKGYEIVNKDLVDNWVIQKDPAARFKIVMCPTGTIAKNTMKYYNISLDCLTRGYETKIKALQEQKEKSEIDARTYAEQARVLSEQYKNQQKRLAELSEKFARENFDDCSAVHRQAFEAFSAGNIPEAIRILESVNSAEEISKAKEQREKGKGIEQEGKLMQLQSDSIIQQHVSKLLFQANLYKSEYRFTEAEQAYETAISADSSNNRVILDYIKYLLGQNKPDQAYHWDSITLSQAGNNREKGFGFYYLGIICNEMMQYSKSEQAFKESIRFFREADSTNIKKYWFELAGAIQRLSEYYSSVGDYYQSISLHQEAIGIQKELAFKGNEFFLMDQLASNILNLGIAQHAIADHQEARASFLEALEIARDLNKRDAGEEYDGILAWSLMWLAMESDRKEADAHFQEALGLMRNLAEKNFEVYGDRLVVILNNYATRLQPLGKTKKARELYLEAYGIAENLMKINPLLYNDLNGVILTNLASVEDELGEYDKSLEHHELAVRYSRELVAYGPVNYKIDLANALINQGVLLQRLKLYEKAFACHEESESILKETAETNPEESLYSLTIVLFNHAELGYETGDTARGTQYFLEGLRVAEQLVSKLPEQYATWGAQYCSDLAWFQLQHRQFALAETFARKAMQFDSTQTWLYTNMAIALLFQNRYDEALKIYLELKDKPIEEEPGQTIKDVFLQDFDDLKKLGITHPDVEKIKALLTK